MSTRSSNLSSGTHTDTQIQYYSVPVIRLLISQLQVSSPETALYFVWSNIPYIHIPSEGFAIESQTIGEACGLWLLQIVHFYPSSDLSTPKLPVIESESITSREQESTWTEACGQLDACFNKLAGVLTTTAKLHSILSMAPLLLANMLDSTTTIVRQW